MKKKLKILLQVLILTIGCAKNSNENADPIFSILETAFSPDILYGNLISISNEDDVWEYFYELRGALIKYSMDLYDISYYNAIFNIAERYMLYAQNDSAIAKKKVAVFGDFILLELTKSIEYNVGKNNLHKDSKELLILCDKLKQFGHIPDIQKISRVDKLWHNMKKGNWKYIFKRIGFEIKGWF